MQKNQQLFLQFKKYGKMALRARNKCIGMLPEIYRREIHLQKGFQSIYEFAAKIAGISREQVDKVLRLERRFQNKPVLHQALVMGEISVNKLVKVASIATVENQSEIMDVVQKLSVRAIEVLVADNKDILQNSDNKNDHVIVQKEIFPEELRLSEEVRTRLLTLQKKGLDLSEVLIELLDQREARLEQEMNGVFGVENKPVIDCALADVEFPANKEINQTKEQHNLFPKKSRYIPVKIKKILKNKYGNKCAIENCYKEAKTIHHDQRFSIFQRHSPLTMRPLCHEHHQLTHLADLKYFEHRLAASSSTIT